MTPRAAVDVYVPYVHYYLMAHKDELLVPLMRGAANVSLSVDRLARLRIPIPSLDEQHEYVDHLVDLEARTLELRQEWVSAQRTFEAQFRCFASRL
jgi:restriction endonuclease S subunit